MQYENSTEPSLIRFTDKVPKHLRRDKKTRVFMTGNYYSIAEKGCSSPFQGFPHPGPLPEGEGIWGILSHPPKRCPATHPESMRVIIG